MAEQYSSAVLGLGIDSKEFNKELSATSLRTQAALAQMKSSADAFSAKWHSLTSGIKDTKRIVSGIVISQGFYTLSNALLSGASAALSFSKNIETAAVSLEYFVSGANKLQKAAAYLREINEFAARTPFSTESALALSRYMQAVGVSMNTTKSFLQVITDTAAATGATEENLQRIVFGLGQMMTKGRIAGEEIRQLANANIPIYEILREELGLTGKEISNIGKHWISADKAVVAILRGLEKRYKGAADKISDTMTGMMDTVVDNLKIISQAAGADLYDNLTSKVTKLRDALDRYREIAVTQGSMGLFNQILVDIDATGKLGNNILMLIGNFRQLGSAAVSLYSAAKPIINLFGKSLYTSISLATMTLTGFMKLADGLVTILNRLGITTGKTAEVIGSLFVAYKAAKWMGTLGQAAVSTAYNLYQTSSSMLNILPAALRASTGVKILSASLAGLIALGVTAIGVFGMLNSASSGLEISGGGFSQDYLASMSKYEAEMEAYNAAIAKYQDSFNAPYTAIEDGTASAIDGLEEVEKKSKKAAGSVKGDWVAAFDEVYSIPDDRGGGGADTALGDLAGLPSLLKLPRFVFPTVKVEELQMPKFDWGEMYEGSAFEDLPDKTWLMAMLPGLLAGAAIALGRLFAKKRETEIAVKTTEEADGKVSKVTGLETEDVLIKRLLKHEENIQKLLEKVTKDTAELTGAIEREKLYGTAGPEARGLHGVSERLRLNTTNLQQLLADANEIRAALGKAPAKFKEIDAASEALRQARAMLVKKQLESIEAAMLRQNLAQQQFLELDAKRNALLKELKTLTISPSKRVDIGSFDYLKLEDYLETLTKELIDSFRKAFASLLPTFGGFTTYYNVGLVEAARDAWEEFISVAEKYIEQSKLLGLDIANEAVVTIQGHKEEINKAFKALFDRDKASVEKLYELAKSIGRDLSLISSADLEKTFKELYGKVSEQTKFLREMLRQLETYTPEALAAAKKRREETAKKVEEAKKILEEQKKEQKRLVDEQIKARKERIEEQVGKRPVGTTPKLDAAYQDNLYALTQSAEDAALRITGGVEDSLEAIAEVEGEIVKTIQKIAGLSTAISEGLQQPSNIGLRREELPRPFREALETLDEQKLYLLGLIEELEAYGKRASNEAYALLSQGTTTNTLLRTIVEENAVAWQALRKTLAEALPQGTLDAAKEQALAAGKVLLPGELESLVEAARKSISTFLLTGTRIETLVKGLGSFGGDIPSLIAAIYKELGFANFGKILADNLSQYARIAAEIGIHSEQLIAALAAQLLIPEFGELYTGGFKVAKDMPLLVQIDTTLKVWDETGQTFKIIANDIKTKSNAGMQALLDGSTEYAAGIRLIPEKLLELLEPAHFAQFVAQTQAMGTGRMIGMSAFNRDFDYTEVEPDLVARWKQLMYKKDLTTTSGGKIFSVDAVLEYAKIANILDKSIEEITESYFKNVITPLFTTAKGINYAPLQHAFQQFVIEFSEKTMSSFKLAGIAEAFTQYNRLIATVAHNPNIADFLHAYIRLNTEAGEELLALNFAPSLRYYKKMQGGINEWLQNILKTSDTLERGSIGIPLQSAIDRLINEYNVQMAKARSIEDALAISGSYSRKLTELAKNVQAYGQGGSIDAAFAEILEGTEEGVRNTSLVSRALYKLSYRINLVNKLPRLMRTLIDNVNKINAALYSGTQITAQMLMSAGRTAEQLFDLLGISMSDAATAIMQQLSDMQQIAARGANKLAVFNAEAFAPIVLPFKVLDMTDTFALTVQRIKSAVEKGFLTVAPGMENVFARIVGDVPTKKIAAGYATMLAAIKEKVYNDFIIDIETTGIPQATQLGETVGVDVVQVSLYQRSTDKLYTWFVDYGERNQEVLNKMASILESWRGVAIEQLQTGLTIKDILLAVAGIVGAEPITGYNAVNIGALGGGFDIKILRAIMGKDYLTLGEDVMTMLINKIEQLTGDRPSFKLTEAYEMLTGRVTLDAHMADADVLMTAAVLKAIEDGTLEKVIKKALEAGHKGSLKKALIAVGRELASAADPTTPTPVIVTNPPSAATPTPRRPRAIDPRTRELMEESLQARLADIDQQLENIKQAAVEQLKKIGASATRQEAIQQQAHMLDTERNRLLAERNKILDEIKELIETPVELAPIPPEPLTPQTPPPVLALPAPAPEPEAMDLAAKEAAENILQANLMLIDQRLEQIEEAILQQNVGSFLEQINASTTRQGITQQQQLELDIERNKLLAERNEILDELKQLAEAPIKPTQATQATQATTAIPSSAAPLETTTQLGSGIGAATEAAARATSKTSQAAIETAQAAEKTAEAAASSAKTIAGAAGRASQAAVGAAEAAEKTADAAASSARTVAGAATEAAGKTSAAASTAKTIFEDATETATKASTTFADRIKSFWRRMTHVPDPSQATTAAEAFTNLFEEFDKLTVAAKKFEPFQIEFNRAKAAMEAGLATPKTDWVQEASIKYGIAHKEYAKASETFYKKIIDASAEGLKSFDTTSTIFKASSDLLEEGLNALVYVIDPKTGKLKLLNDTLITAKDAISDSFMEAAKKMAAAKEISEEVLKAAALEVQAYTEGFISAEQLSEAAKILKDAFAELNDTSIIIDAAGNIRHAGAAAAEAVERAAEELSNSFSGLGKKLVAGIWGFGIIDVASILLSGYIQSTSDEAQKEALAYRLSAFDETGFIEEMQNMGVNIGKLFGDSVYKGVGDIMVQKTFSSFIGGAVTTGLLKFLPELALISAIPGLNLSAIGAAAIGMLVTAGADLLMSATGGSTDTSLYLGDYLDVLAKGSVITPEIIKEMEDALGRPVTEAEISAQEKALRKAYSFQLMAPAQGSYWDMDKINRILFGEATKKDYLEGAFKTSDVGTRLDLRLLEALDLIEYGDVTGIYKRDNKLDTHGPTIPELRYTLTVRDEAALKYLSDILGANLSLGKALSDGTYQVNLEDGKVLRASADTDMEGLQELLDLIYIQGIGSGPMSEAVIGAITKNTGLDKAVIDRYGAVAIEAHKNFDSILDLYNEINNTTLSRADADEIEGFSAALIRQAIDIYNAHTAMWYSQAVEQGRFATINRHVLEGDTASLLWGGDLKGITSDTLASLEAFGIKLTEGSILVETGLTGIIEQTYIQLATDAEMLRENLAGWLVDASTYEGLDLSEVVLSANDVSILAQAGIQINEDGSVSFMRALNEEVTGAVRQMSLGAADFSQNIIDALSKIDVTLDFEAGTLDFGDMSGLKKQMTGALFTLPEEIRTSLSDDMRKALKGLGEVMDDGYILINNSAVLNGEMSITEYISSVKGATNTLGPKVIEALQNVDTLIQQEGRSVTDNIIEWASSIVVPSPIKAEQITEDIEKAFAEIGISFMHYGKEFLMVVNATGEHISDGMTLIDAAKWNSISEDLRKALEDLGVKVTPIANQVMVDLNDTFDNGIYDIVGLFTEQPELWNLLPESTQQVLAEVGIVSDGELLAIKKLIAGHITEVSDGWIATWNSLSPATRQALADLGLDTESGLLKIGQIIDEADIPEQVDGQIVVPFEQLPGEIQEALGANGLAGELKGKMVVLKSAAEDCFSGLVSVVGSTRTGVVSTAQSMASEIAAAVASALTAVNRLNSLEVGSSGGGLFGIGAKKNTVSTALGSDGKTYYMEWDSSSGGFIGYHYYNAKGQQIKLGKILPTGVRLMSSTSAPGRAEGGPASGITLVGEEGQELAILPDGSTQYVGSRGGELVDFPDGTQIVNSDDTANIAKYVQPSRLRVRALAGGTASIAADTELVIAIESLNRILRSYLQHTSEDYFRTDLTNNPEEDNYALAAYIVENIHIAVRGATDALATHTTEQLDKHRATLDESLQQRLEPIHELLINSQDTRVEINEGLQTNTTAIVEAVNMAARSVSDVVGMTINGLNSTISNLQSTINSQVTAPDFPTYIASALDTLDFDNDALIEIHPPGMPETLIEIHEPAKTTKPKSKPKDTPDPPPQPTVVVKTVPSSIGYNPIKAALSTRGSLVTDDALYRAGEYGLAEAIIPLERQDVLQKVGAAIAQNMPTEQNAAYATYVVENIHIAIRGATDALITHMATLQALSEASLEESFEQGMGPILGQLNQSHGILVEISGRFQPATADILSAINMAAYSVSNAVGATISGLNSTIAGLQNAINTQAQPVYTPPTQSVYIPPTISTTVPSNDSLIEIHEPAKKPTATTPSPSPSPSPPPAAAPVTVPIVKPAAATPSVSSSSLSSVTTAKVVTKTTSTGDKIIYLPVKAALSTRGSLVTDDALYRAGEYGLAEAIIPLERQDVLQKVGVAIARNIPIEQAYMLEAAIGRRNAGIASPSSSAAAPMFDTQGLVQNVLETILPALAANQAGEESRPNLNVGVLIADEQGLKQLERKLYTIRLNEERRRL